MDANFHRSYQRVLQYEGGWTNDPHDPGGPTYQGILQREYSAWRRRRGKADQDVRKMTPEEREEIYLGQYWQVAKCDKLPPGIDFVVYDGAVNSGPSQSVKWLQRAVGVRADGVVGEVTLEATWRAPDHDLLIGNICDQRMAFLRRLDHWARFKNGWTARVKNVRATGQAWAMGSIGPAVDMTAEGRGGGAKAKPDQVAVAPVSVETGAGATIGTTAAGGALTQTADKLNEISSQLSTLAYTLEIVGYVMVGIALVSAGLTVYAIYKRSKDKKAMAITSVEAL